MTRMSWDKLLSRTRYVSDFSRQAPVTHPVSQVSVFLEDAERIMYSSPFRRMQGKTQVHPLPVLDYVRTRLTHTIEVAHAGRIIATECARSLKERGDLTVDAAAFADVTYAGCLAHDIGNPPFGHIGEFAIQTWFERNLSEGRLTARLRGIDEIEDFLKFDGNAQGFRILTATTGWRAAGGLQLSYAALGTFSKYPWASKSAPADKKKFGYMAADATAAKKIYSELGLIDRGDGRLCRHPLAFIVEAADDICYLTTDIEDAFRTKFIKFESAERLLKDIAETASHAPRYPELKAANEQDRIAYLRGGAVSALIDAATQSFITEHDNILQGKFTSSLLDVSKFKSNVADIRSFCREVVYKDLAKMQVEAAGYNIIMTLMDLFGGMLDQFIARGQDKLDMRNDGIYQLMPREFREALNQADPYRCYLVLVDYISGMTDRFALDLFQKLTGSSVGLGRMG
jgi:dGTPase